MRKHKAPGVPGVVALKNGGRVRERQIVGFWSVAGIRGLVAFLPLTPGLRGCVKPAALAV